MDDTAAQTDSGNALGASSDTTDFTRQVAEYFGAYVSGTISSNGLPQRVYGDTYSYGLIRKVPLERYGQLNKNLYKNFVTGLSQRTFVITQNKYTAKHDEHILRAVRLNISKITERETLSLLRALAFQAGTRLIEETSGNQADIVDELLSEAKHAISNDLVVPFIIPFENVDVISNKDERHLLVSLREAAVSRLFDASKELLRNIYTAYFASTSYVTKDSLMVTLAEAFTPKRVKDSLEHFADDLEIDDAYQHTYALHRSALVRDGAGMYVYFGELQYDMHAFPLFYTKVESRHSFPSVTLQFSGQIAVNKQAIEYVARHFAARTNQPIDIASLKIPNVIHSVEEIALLQQVVTQLTQAFKLSNDIAIAKPAAQESANHLVRLSNRVYFYVDMPSGAAIARDYQELAANGTLAKKAEAYLDTLLVNPVTQIVEEVADEWSEKPDFDKLLPGLPLPVNDEQQQVLSALAKDTGKHVVVDAAVGTGKKRLIDAAVLSALTKGQSVLVVSGTERTAARPRKRIGMALEQASGRRGYNPVLNLHDGDIFDHIDDQLVTDVEKSAHHVEANLQELTAAKKRKKQALQDSLSQFIQNAEDINLHEVERAVTNERRFAGIDWITDEPIDAIGSSIQKLHRAVHYVRDSEASYLMPYVENDQQAAIESFITTYRDYEKASKDVQARLPEFVVRYRKLLPEQKQQLQEDLAYIQSNYRQFVKILKDQPASSWLGISDTSTFREVAQQEVVLGQVLAIAQDALRYLADSDTTALLRELDGYDATPAEIVDVFETYVEQITTLKSRLFGFSGRMPVVENLNKQLLKSLPSFSLPEPEKQAENMQLMSQFVGYVADALAAANLPVYHWKDVIHILLTSDSKLNEITEIMTKLNQIASVDFALGFKIYDADNLLANITMLQYATELNRMYRDFPQFGKLFGITTMNHLLARPREFMLRITKLARDLGEATQLNEAKQTVAAFIDTYPAAAKRLGIGFTNGNVDLGNGNFAGSDGEFVKEYVSYKKSERDLYKYFNEVATDSFESLSTEYRQILGVELQYALNKAFLQFMEANSTSLDTLSSKLKERQKLTVAEAKQLMKLFPCIVSDARGLSEVLPLDVHAFDLVIINVADSLSIAEVLPAVLRAKKVLVIGDSVQSQPSRLPLHGAVNGLYTERIAATFAKKVNALTIDSKKNIIAKQSSLLSADISALEFFSASANYSTSLTKQYGAYEELMAFGNKYYYGNKLISLTSRAVPLTAMFTFAELKPKREQVSRFTNGAEVDYIVQHLQTLKDQGFSGTIGIVVPFAEQAALLQKELDECVITDWFARRDLRVMTFDTKRHHDRDYVYYSLVASSEFNDLAQQLPAEIGADAYPHDPRSHRLLTGFSGAQHTMHIVHSLPLESYNGGLGTVLSFLNEKLHQPLVAVNGSSTDIQLAMEANLAQAFAKTNFAKKHSDHVSFIAKYPFTNYIKPLSPGYYKAPYRIHFLAMVDDRPIVVEFDDFKDKFLQNNTKSKAGTYLSEQDAYAYKQLEGYGYRFVRLNKFNIGDNPVHTLDTYLSELAKVPTWPRDNGFVA